MRCALGIALACIPPLLAGNQGTASARQAAAPAAESPADEDLRHLRALAKILVSVEGRHRTQVAELERLTRVADERRLPALARLAIQTRHAERQDYEERMRTLEQQLGPVLYARFRAAMDVGPGSEPALRPVPPEPAPPTPLLPHEKERLQDEKRAQGREEGGG